MKRLALALILASLAFPVLHAGPARAAANDRSWVSGTGSDANTCLRTAPCASFSGALAKTNAGGEINCVDQGEFGNGTTLNINKSITIDCEGVQARIAGPSGQVAVIVAGLSTDVVVLRGLDLSGNGVGIEGILFTSGAALHVEKCVIHDFSGAGIGWGIVFEIANASATVELYVSDTVVMNNSVSGTSAGILVRPTVSNTISKVILDRVEARNNFFGIKADGTWSGVSGGVVNMTVRDSVASGNGANGIVGTSNAGGPAIVMMVDNSTASHNGAGYGVIADGPKTFIQMTRSSASGNNFGIGTSGGGTLLSYGNNQVSLNSTDGSPTGVISFK